ncbi:DNA-binding transcriptional response regulator, NtrC family, contains REC, AAA-type ATPase, and a Fis-type DNA-binding domains [Paucidesulfovibrio gracilis DSM 16080]|uniref:DNA-binding transcriptional response regulator, NtrC family, contains REC, AAA-type ATPase, and a Fis-type DNA-binding domains n=1 Tax=Paucidesulfovibrio gracilis DSM 16080 TaxID=1121449 RepID=A0A1T4X2F8_9BACT|nr:sigma-54 dependent transcriptional regulator [Paucidesulfovibrio gracilis]SKA83659.1 DNA-binding transcriptional response regulator, NtrC family, contains REC, AAA-type ATPase, and a Fis-type DNA-binding domains [Paucidesulfovibrio gracilis DSM 16080]
MANKRVVLVVDDDPGILDVMEARLASAGLEPVRSENAEQALSIMEDRAVDLVVSDVKMPGMGGEGLLAEVREQYPHIPVILLTAYGTIPDAVALTRSGAADYLTKPFDGKELVRRVRELLPREDVSGRDGCAEIRKVLWGGESPAMRRFQQLLERVARTDVNVLVAGESGTGKELAARLLHQLSRRSDGPFVVVDCGSTPASLLESELFGHVKGSFTHALRDKKGLIAQADKGTLFLDEIGNISPEMQTRLLRFLQEGTIRPVGDVRDVRVESRVVAATNADLREMVRGGEFREDLYYRIKVVTLVVPPLRERPEDIPLLAQRFLERACGEQDREPLRFSSEAMELLCTHSWPGNVRELRHAVEAGAVFATDGLVRPADLQLEDVSVPRSADHPRSTQGDDTELSLENNERQAILRALEHTRWNKTAAADLLGISRRAIHYKINKYGLREPGRE